MRSAFRRIAIGIAMALLPAVVCLCGNAAAPPKKPPKDDNPLAGCTMCHVDIEDAYVESKHYAKKVSCIKCHGKSEGHLADENNEVKPDRMFTRKNTDAFCEECHECDREPLEPPPSKHKICTECHGAHDLKLAGKEGESG